MRKVGYLGGFFVKFELKFDAGFGRKFEVGDIDNSV